jgi:hypothetical protein
MSLLADSFFLTRSVSNDTALPTGHKSALPVGYAQNSKILVNVNVVWYVTMERQTTRNEVVVVMIMCLLGIRYDGSQ